MMILINEETTIMFFIGILLQQMIRLSSAHVPLCPPVPTLPVSIQARL